MNSTIILHLRRVISVHFAINYQKLYGLFLMAGLPLVVPPLLMLLAQNSPQPAGFCLWALMTMASACNLARLCGKIRVGSPTDLAVAALSLWCGTWFCLLLIFFIPPLLAAAAGAIAAHTEFAPGPALLLAALFLLASRVFKALCLLLFSPFILAARAGADLHRALAGFTPRGKIMATTLAALIMATATLVLAVPHARNNDFVLDKYDYANLSAPDRAEIFRNEKYYRSLLTAIYLVPLKSPEAGSSSLQKIYANAFGVNPDAIEPMQRIFDFVAAPLRPRGLARDAIWKQRRAEKIYRTLFKAGIQDGERETILLEAVNIRRFAEYADRNGDHARQVLTIAEQAMAKVDERCAWQLFR